MKIVVMPSPKMQELERVEPEDRMTPNDRKTRSEALLEKFGVPYFPGLPCIESEEQTELRSSEEAGIRMLCLFSVIGTAYHWNDRSYRRYLKKHGLWDHLTPKELAFMSSPLPDRQTAKDLTWRVEALFVLAWAVGLIAKLPVPDRQSDNEALLDLFPSFRRSPWPFVRGLKLRTKTEIVNAADLIYRLHWATTQAKIEDRPPPANLDPEVVYQWHHAINWLTKYDDADWDHVPTDT